MRRHSRFLAFCAALALVTSACGGGDDPVQAADGRPGDAADADRTVDVAMLDTLVYDPAELTVAVGETVTFALTNRGETTHEFTLGTDEQQLEHEQEMDEMDGDMEGMSDDDPNVVSLEPGEQGELTWAFTEPGTYRYGCHEPEHFDAGMVGTITVTS